MSPCQVCSVEAENQRMIKWTVLGDPAMAEKGLLTCVPASKLGQVECIKPYCTGG